ncbi:MAG: hypothetical protein WD768_15335 [Phycisphaeraceae bacterium]
MTTRLSWKQTAAAACLTVLLCAGFARAEGSDPVRSLKDSAPVFFADDTERLAFAAEGDPAAPAGGDAAPVTPAAAESSGFMAFFNNPEGYTGGRGLISLQGMSGMFINPTSGTLNQGQLTVQWCILYQADVLGAGGAKLGVEVIGNGVLAAYGITDWIEIGVYTVLPWLDPSPFKGNGDEELLWVIGPFARVRLLKDDGWIPEVSVGGIWLDGDASSDLVARQEIFVAASKYFKIDPDGIFKGFRVHGGVRFIWKNDGLPGSEDFGVVGFIGGELELPYSLWVIAEVANESGSLGPRVPYAFGLQWRPNEVLGLTLGGVQPGDADTLAFYFGIGLNFKF